jgi:multidrug transporter EmrE-like cation transporter
MNLIYGIIYGLVAQIGSYMQLQGAMKYGWYQKYFWLILISSIPLSWLYIKSVEHIILAFNGQIWPSRLIGFGLGITVFSIMSHYLFREPFTPKTIVCICLGLLIIGIQIFWK